MRKAYIPKGNGEFRVVYCPTEEEKASYRSHISDIVRRVKNLPNSNCIHGFYKRRSPVTMAQAHIGHDWTITMDIKNFFPNCTREKLQGKISKKILDQVLVDNHAAQGLPTSPALANLAASVIDNAIMKWIENNNKQCVYTRYADDIAISGDDHSLIDKIIKAVKDIVSRCGWTIHPKKTHVYYTNRGRRIICGISVGENDIKPTRKMKRKLRAAQFQSQKGNPMAVHSCHGLQEWCRLKEPNQGIKSFKNNDSESIYDDIKAVSKVWNLKNVQVKNLVQKEENDLGDNVLITGDPIYMLGMSTYTTGWTSCMRHPNGQYRRGTLFWNQLRGTRVGILIDPSRIGNHGGVERPLMFARTLVHELRDIGILVFDRIYGAPDKQQILKDKLKEHGVISIQEAKTKYCGHKVIGHAPASYRGYFDNLKSKVATAKSGPWKGKKVKVVSI